MFSTSVRLSDETASKLDRLSAATGRSKSYYLREAIEESIDRLVWEYDLVRDVEKYRAGELKTVSLEDLEVSLDLEG